MTTRTRTLIVLLLALAAAGDAAAQQHETITADLTFYGDNTEFANPFREGETLFGVFGRIVLDVEVGERVRIEGGVFGNQRYGSARSFEQIRPVLALVVHNARQQFRFGTLAPASTLPRGPDRQTLHGLIPPLQAETVSLTRPWEAGLQWTTSSPGLTQEAWIGWQQLNTARHRERFDAGVSGTWRVSRRTALLYQSHVVHQGGQLFASGPVSDSYALALGPRLAVRPAGVDDLSVETLAIVSRDVPDRETSSASRTGRGLFVRGAATRRGWRGHVIVFRGWHVVKAEGDPNYLSIRRDGTAFRRVRDYAEAGLSRQFQPAPQVAVEASFRLHRVESHYEYSYRIVGRTHLAWPIR